MPWKSGTVMDQRIEFIVRAKAKEKTLSELCREYGISRPTGYLWLKRYEENGSITGLKEKSCGRKASPQQTDQELERVEGAFGEEKGWGGRRLQVLMGREGD